MKSGSTYGPTAISTSAPAPNISTERRSERRRVSADAAAAATGTLLTREPLWAEAQDQRGEYHDRQTAENGVAIGADQHLRAAEHRTRDREAHERHARNQHQHERIHQPRHAHIRIDAGQRRD